jgi:hypothetical protein
MPELLTRAGVIEDGEPVSYDTMTERMRREILGLESAFSTGLRSGRVELVVRGAGNDLEEAGRAIRWMELALLYPDWRPANLPRLRDVVDQTLNRGENMVVIFINNGIYGMTGGQMAPTTLIGQVTATTPNGRDVGRNGYPLKITELIAQLPGTSYVTRQSVHNPASIRRCRKAISKAFQAAMDKKGTSFVEVVSTCNMNWKMTPVKANEWMVDNMFPFYVPGDLKDSTKTDPESYSPLKN